MQNLGNNHKLVMAFKKQHGINYGVNNMHVCNVDECSFKQLGNTHVFGCSESLHMHVCSNKYCKLARDTRLGMRVCPISGIEMKEDIFVAPETVKYSGRGGVRFLKAGISMGKKKSRKKRKKKQAPLVSTNMVCSTVNNIIAAKNNKDPKIMQNILFGKQKCKDYPFTLFIGKAVKFFEVYKMQSSPPVNLFCSIANYCNKVFQFLTPRPTVPVLISVIFSLLQTGFTAKNVQIFPKVEWINEVGIQLTAYARVKHVQCRAMSICTRALKRLIFEGESVQPAFIFNF